MISSEVYHLPFKSIGDYHGVSERMKWELLSTNQHNGMTNPRTIGISPTEHGILWGIHHQNMGILRQMTFPVALHYPCYIPLTVYHCIPIISHFIAMIFSCGCSSGFLSKTPFSISVLYRTVPRGRPLAYDGSLSNTCIYI